VDHAAACPWFFNQNTSATQLMPNAVEQAAITPARALEHRNP